MIREDIARQLPHVLYGTDFDQWLGAKIRGKARDNYVVNGQRIIVATDRVSAFDRQLGCIPFKGQLVTQMSLFWFDLTRDIVANHVLASPDPNVTVAREYKVLPVEFVVRAYLTGVTPTSIWYQYSRGNRTYCGHRLPDGLKKNAPLPEPILTPSTKAHGAAHDESLAPEDLVRRGAIAEADLKRAGDIALALFQQGQKIAAERGIVLVDTKYEFGLSADGEIVLVDEIHTPDSSRFWYRDEYARRYASGLEQEEYDKEFIRLWLAAKGFEGNGAVPDIPDDVFIDAASRYIRVFETLTGKTFEAQIGDPGPRIAGTLRAYAGVSR